MKVVGYLVLLALVVAILLCFQMHVDGDTGAVGVFALAVGHGDDGYFLNHFYWTDFDPHTFTDLMIAVPLQIVSGYSPTVLKFTGFMFFLFWLSALAYSVYWATGDKKKGLVVAALALSIATPMLLFSMLVTFHNTVIGLAILYLVWSYRFADRPVWQKAVLVAGAALIVYSDMIFIALFVLPYTASLVLRRAKVKEYLYPLMIIGSAVLSMTIKWNLLGNVAMKGPDFETPVMIVFNAISILPSIISVYLTPIWGHADMLGMCVVALLAVLYICLIAKTKLPRTDKARYLFITMGAGAVVMCGGYSIVGAFTIMRFLLYPALFVLAALAMGLNTDTGWKEIRGYVCAILAIAIVMNIFFVSNIDNENTTQYGLIKELKARNITYGYAWFQVCEPLTYLSKGDVKIMSAYQWGDGMTVSHWLNERNYVRDSGPGCIITHDEPAWRYVNEYPPEYNFTYEDYTVYVYDNLRI